jgi:hypothetical protein
MAFERQESANRANETTRRVVDGFSTCLRYAMSPARKKEE